jgi:hypothetical protein
MFGRNKVRVRKNIVHIFHPHCAGVAQVINLYGYRALREYSRPAVFRMALQVNCDINFQFPHQVRRRMILEICR